MIAVTRRHTLLAGSAALSFSLAGCGSQAIALEGGIAGLSLLNWGKTVAGGLALNVASNCVYDHLNNRACHFFGEAKASTNPEPVRSPSDAMMEIKRIADARGLDFDLCRTTASATSTKDVLDCLNGEGTIWYERNETNYEVNRYKIIVKNPTGEFLSPKISIGLYSRDLSDDNADIILAHDFAIDLQPHNPGYDSYLYVQPTLRLEGGLKSLRLRGYVGDSESGKNLAISKSIDIIVCPGTIYQKRA